MTAGNRAADAWLAARLAGRGPVEVSLLAAEARRRDVSRPALYRARDRLGLAVTGSRYEVDRPVRWSLPTEAEEEKET